MLVTEETYGPPSVGVIILITSILFLGLFMVSIPMVMFSMPHRAKQPLHCSKDNACIADGDGVGGVCDNCPLEVELRQLSLDVKGCESDRVDCSGQCDGTLTQDRCGVCGGDGQSCIGCLEEESLGRCETPEDCPQIQGMPSWNPEIRCTDEKCVYELDPGCPDGPWDFDSSSYDDQSCHVLLAEPPDPSLPPLAGTPIHREEEEECNACSVHGTCNFEERLCECDPGWTGPDCSVTRRIPIAI